MKNLILIDGHSLAYRMYFALERTQMKTADQFPTWGVFGFFKTIFELLKMTEPDGMAIAFDVGRETFRTELYPAYKAHREKMPDALVQQMSKIREGVELLGIPIFELPNYEADDVIGTLARKAASEGVNVTILTGDQDAFQVIDPEARISLLVPSFQGGLSRYDRQKVFEKWGVYPEQVTDFKGLKGDTSDNIPGVPGVGDKTAAKLLAQYQTLENVLANVEAISGKKLQENLTQYKEQAILSKLLATIRYDAPVEFTEDACHLRIPDIDDFLKFLADCEFRAFLNQYQTLLKPFLAHLTEVAEDAPHGQLRLGDLPQPSSVSGTEASPPVVLPQAGSVHDLLPHYVPAFRLIESEAELAAFLHKAQASGVLTLDIETSGLDFLTNQLAGVAMAWAPGLQSVKVPAQNTLHLDPYPQSFLGLTVSPEGLGEMDCVYVPLMHPDLDTSLTTEQVLALLNPVLSSPDVVKVAHNAKFETNTFRHLGVTLAGPIFDTMVANYVYNPEARHGLKVVAHDILGHQMQEISDLIGSGKKQIPFTQVPVKDAAPYAACDAAVTLELATWYVQHLDNQALHLLYEVEFPLVSVLADMEYSGVSLDSEYLGTLSVELTSRLATLESEIYDLAGLTFNLNSPKQVGDVLFEHLKIPAKGMTPTKSGYSTNAKVLESLAPDYPVVQKLLDYRQLFKLKSTYIDTLPAMVSPVDKRLHASFNQTVTATGRLSSSDPNLQNIPIRSDIGRLIRQGFVPRDQQGFRIVSADYSQIELRLLAHFSEDPSLVSAFQSGEDIHAATAALVFGIPLERVSKTQRYQAKAVNFGIIYGQTAFGLANTLGIPPREASEFIERYFSRYPKVRVFIESTKAEARASGKVATLCGRVRDLSEGLGSTVRHIREFSERAAFNTPLQGSASDLMKVAMIRLNDAIYREGLQSRLILQVHDEIVVEMALAEKERVTELVHWAMELGQPLRVPLVIDLSEGPSWMEIES